MRIILKERDYQYYHDVIFTDYAAKELGLLQPLSVEGCIQLNRSNETLIRLIETRPISDLFLGPADELKFQIVDIPDQATDYRVQSALVCEYDDLLSYHETVTYVVDGKMHDMYMKGD